LRKAGLPGLDVHQKKSWPVGGSYLAGRPDRSCSIPNHDAGLWSCRRGSLRPRSACGDGGDGRSIGSRSGCAVPRVQTDPGQRPRTFVTYRGAKATPRGESDPHALAGLRHPRLACPHEELIAALDGRLRDHHRFLIGQHLKTVEQLDATIAEFNARLESRLRLFRDAIERRKESRRQRQRAQTRWPRSAPI